MAKQVRKPSKPRRPVQHYVKEWRTYRELTQDQLAERVGKTRGLISQIESGTTELTEGMIYALADAFRHTPGDVFRVNPLKEGLVVDITDALRGAPSDVQAEALGFVRGIVGGRKQ
ncbi:helix-turn-helix domain-containing protein [Mesorhizobium sp. M0050]|uniref:helix-turn-helix domain-containing protein n=1 Tax=unclassified Mesorhizobium TaxID=325217 RepID=UPI0003D00CCC|nr:MULTISPECIES: helix-turn-helix transcriptional regulator [unclassified Mesorhizobium]ESZ60510.1 XRE family transcriptional regulator [Mesorhizobium sp. L103C120A0]WJI43729.1 helix-turn-helix domain-containing protein [Mesorhizobium sp. C120A]